METDEFGLKIDVEKRLFYIYGSIDTGLNEASFELQSLIQDDIMKYSKNKKEKVPNINIVINSFGGSLMDTLSFCDIIKSSYAPVITYATGNCFSAALLLLMAGGVSLAFENTSFLIHSPSFFKTGQYCNVNDAIKHVDNENSYFLKYIENNSDLDMKKIKKIFDSARDYFFNVEEAKDMGIIQGITDRIFIPTATENDIFNLISN